MGDKQTSSPRGASVRFEIQSPNSQSYFDMKAARRANCFDKCYREIVNMINNPRVLRTCSSHGSCESGWWELNQNVSGCLIGSLHATGNHLTAGQWGTHPPANLCFGRSMVINPWGLVVAQAPDGVSAVVADIDLEILHRIRTTFPALRHRRKDLFAT
jgi:hypothetical protein